MTLLTRVRGLINDHTIHECRRCGTTLEADIEECPICGTQDVASYEIE